MTDLTMNKKPVLTMPAKSVINMDSGFKHKLLCSGPSFSAGDACAYSCSFCFVEAQMAKSQRVIDAKASTGLEFEQLVIRRAGTAQLMTDQLYLKDGTPRFSDPKDNRVIYASPLVDVAANITLAKETIELCRIILKATHWDIRLLSKSNLLPYIAEALEPYKKRMIYGVSTGTLDDKVAQAFEVGTALVSKRIASIHKLQNAGFRTFGMICPSLPQDDYAKFAVDMADALRIDKMEHVWGEVINLRGASFTRTIACLENAGLKDDARRLKETCGDSPKWEEYARETFLAEAAVIPSHQLRFLQYVTPSSRDWWYAHVDKGALPIGMHAIEPAKGGLDQQTLAEAALLTSMS